MRVWICWLAIVSLSACELEGQHSCSGASPHPSCEQAKAFTPTHLDCDPACVAAAPYCDRTSNRCFECLEDAHCADNALATRCDIQAGRCTNPCAVATEATDCEGKSCDTQFGYCSVVLPGDKQACEPCGSDIECILGHRCFETTFDGAPQGGHCLPVRSGPDCLQAPFHRLGEGPTVQGQGPLSYCTIYEAMTTCETVLDVQNFQTCDEQCGIASNDHRCELVGNVSNVCTFSCEYDKDCPRDLECAEFCR